MNDKAGGVAPKVWWFATIAMIGTLVAYNIWLLSQQHALRAGSVAVDQDLADVHASLTRYDDDVTQLNQIRHSAVSNDFQARRGYVGLPEMLQSCKSRNDFIVREGPKFAWSELSSSTEHEKRIGFYAPAGKHWFKYAVRGADQRGSQTPFTFGDARKLEGAVAVELHDAPEIYEVQLKHNERGTITVALIGSGDTPIHESTLPLIDAPCRLKLAVRTEYCPAYPNELKNDFRAKRYFEENRSAPVTELASMFIKEVRPQLPRQIAYLRMWIESDAGACMSAMTVAQDYQEVMSLRYSHDPTSRTTWDPRYQEREFELLFRRYDGSGRYYFRAGVFAK